MLRKVAAGVVAAAVLTAGTAPAYAESLSFNEVREVEATAPPEVLGASGASKVTASSHMEGIVTTDFTSMADAGGTARLRFTASGFGSSSVQVAWRAVSPYNRLLAQSLTTYDFTVSSATVPAEYCDSVLTGAKTTVQKAAKAYDGAMYSQGLYKLENCLDGYKPVKGRGYKVKGQKVTFTKAGRVTVKLKSGKSTVSVSFASVHSKASMLKKVRRYAKRKLKSPSVKSAYARNGAVYIRCKSKGGKYTCWCSYLNGKLRFAACPWW